MQQIEAIDKADVDAEAAYNKDKLYAEQNGISSDEASGGLGEFKRFADHLEIKVARNEMALRKRIANCKALLTEGAQQLDQTKLETGLSEVCVVFCYGFVPLQGVCSFMLAVRTNRLWWWIGG